MSEFLKKAKWLGPTGVNPDLGYVEHGQLKNFYFKEIYQKYLDLNLIEEILDVEDLQDKKAKSKKN